MLIYTDYPVSGQLGFQDPGTKTFEGVLDLNDRIMYYLIILLILVVWVLASSLLNKNYVNIAHGNLIELIWTLTPALILWGIGIPSLKLLYIMDEILDSELTVKAIGNQWYWNYELTDNKDIVIESYMLDDSSLEKGDIRLLTVDNSLVLPTNTSIRLLVTSNDVIHSFAVPSLGLKSDAIPGRLNATGLIINRTSNYYGQCSELCGVLHGFMPISINAVNLGEYINYIKSNI
jgi:cytochrome c oxidase subunit 2